MHILLVDDDIVSQKVASQFLARWAMEVTIAQNGREAMQLLNLRHFNLVLMDLNMPDIDGCETTRTIRANNDPYFQNLPVLAYTASAVADSKEKAEKLGMNDFVSKPFKPEEMHCKINHYVLRNLVESRPLKIHFELYADSDPDFKMELVELMMGNLRDLQSAAYRSYYACDPGIFHSISHKVKSTLILLNDREFMYVIDDLKQALNSGMPQPILQEKINKLSFLSESICKTLNAEISVLKTAC